jgi:hypothetical protein
MKDCRNLLESPLDPPAGQIEHHQGGGRIPFGVQQIRNQHQRFFSGPVQGDPAHDAPRLGPLAASPPPVLHGYEVRFL